MSEFNLKQVSPPSREWFYHCTITKSGEGGGEIKRERERRKKDERGSKGKSIEKIVRKSYPFHREISNGSWKVKEPFATEPTLITNLGEENSRKLGL